MTYRISVHKVKMNEGYPWYVELVDEETKTLVIRDYHLKHIDFKGGEIKTLELPELSQTTKYFIEVKGQLLITDGYGIFNKEN